MLIITTVALRITAGGTVRSTRNRSAASYGVRWLATARRQACALQRGPLTSQSLSSASEASEDESTVYHDRPVTRQGTGAGSNLPLVHGDVTDFPTASIRPSYRAANRAQKRVMPDEGCTATDQHRQAAMRALGPRVGHQAKHRCGRLPDLPPPAPLGYTASHHTDRRRFRAEEERRYERTRALSGHHAL
jgi:hypothetical protein